MNHHMHNKLYKPKEEQPITYKPLVIILIFCFILCLTRSDRMHSFMGYFFLLLSLFKFFDLKGFVDGFSTYDLITKHFRPYGYIYPFIEFFLGLAYLLQVGLFYINLITLLVMTISGVGVLQSILKGQKLKCACMGTILNVPLSTISLIENFGMAAMAVYSLIASSV